MWWRSTFDRAGLLMLGVLVVAGCRSNSPQEGTAAADAANPNVSLLAERVAGALRTNDARALSQLAVEGSAIRIEIRETLVETDERGAQEVAGPEALSAWLRQQSPRWRCRGVKCPWPRGLATDGEAHCAGDCCRFDYRGGMSKRRLYLRQICFAARQGSQRRLSLLGFAEAR